MDGLYLCLDCEAYVTRLPDGSCPECGSGRLAEVGFACGPVNKALERRRDEKKLEAWMKAVKA